MSRKRRKRINRHHSALRRGGYTPLDMLMASATELARPDLRQEMLLSMHAALDAIATGDSPTVRDWRSLADAVNLCQALVECGQATDADGTIDTAAGAMADAAERHGQGKPMRLSGSGLTAVRAALGSWQDALEQLPERAILSAKAYTIRRVAAARAGRARKGDRLVEINT